MVLVALVLTFRLAGAVWGADGFAVYLLLRRVVGFIAPIATIGLDVALPKYIASHQDGLQRSDFIGAASSSVVIVLLCFGLAISWFEVQIGFLLFGQAARPSWLSVLFVMVCGSALYGLAHSYWRGRFAVTRAAILYVICWAIVPIVTVLFFRESPLAGLSAFGIAVALICLLSLAKQEVWRSISLRGVVAATPLLLSNGLPRMVTALVISFLMVLPVLVAARTEDILLAGVTGFALTFVGALGSLVSPVGVVILPKFARYFALQIDDTHVMEELRRLQVIAVGAAMVITGLLWIAAEQVLVFFFQDGVSPYVGSFQLLVLGAPLYVYFAVTRHLIDASDWGLQNTYSAAIATAGFVIVYVLGTIASAGEPRSLLGAGLFAAFALLAVRTYVSSLRIRSRR